LDLLAYKVHPVQMDDRVQEVLKVYLVCLDERDHGETLDYPAILESKVHLDHLDNLLLVSLNQTPPIHKQETMTRDRQLHALRVSLGREVLQGLKEDQVLRDRQAKMVHKVPQATEAVQVQLVHRVLLGQEDVMETLVLLDLPDILDHVAHKERKEQRA
jgi:hypothetical protein